LNKGILDTLKYKAKYIEVLLKERGPDRFLADCRRTSIFVPPQFHDDERSIVFVTTMAAAIEPTWTTALFRPTTRDRDGDDSNELPMYLTELELLPDLSPEHVLATEGITYENFCHFLGDDKVVWMAPGLYVCSGYSNHRDVYPFVLGSSNHQGSHHLHVCVAWLPQTATAATTATCDFLVRLLATRKANEAFIGGDRVSPLPISGPALSHFCQEIQDNHREFALDDVILNAEQIHALATESQTDMDIILKDCKLLGDPDCHAAFVECLRRDGGPIQLDGSKIDCHVLAAALEGNSRVTRLNLKRATSDAGKGVMFRSLAENKGLVELDLNNCFTSDENWTILCQSLQGHPTLTILNLRGTCPRAHIGIRIVLPNEQKAQRTRVLAAMVEDNRVLHTIRLHEEERDEQIYWESILPHLEMNHYRPRVVAITRENSQLFRRAVLGRAALQTNSVKGNSNLLWMFLSGNADVVVQSNEHSKETEATSSAPVDLPATRKRKR
jgi:hypothetical protein